jgi:hypothetical protein
MLNISVNTINTFDVILKDVSSNCKIKLFIGVY